MKLNSIKYIILLFTLPFCLNAQIVNGGFETWVDGNPVGWMTNNVDNGQMSVYPITQTQNANSGNYAVKGEVLSIAPTPQGKIAPMLQAGDGQSGFPFDSRPNKLTGKYMFKSVGGDELVANVFLRIGEQVLGAATFTQNQSTGTGEYKEMIFNIGYIDSSDTKPDRIDLVFTIRSTNGTYPHEGSTFYLDDIPGLSVLEPANDEVVISGEVDTVAWSAGGLTQIDLEYRLNDNDPFEKIVSNYPADSNRYFWDVPEKLLTRKAMVRIMDSDNPENKDSTDHFNIKPWQFTRINAFDKFELFKPDEDGWNFCNCASNIWPESEWEQIDYQNLPDPFTAAPYPDRIPFNVAPKDIFPSWEIFVRAFGVSQCYLGSGTSPTSYNSRAVTIWRGIADYWGGSCYGFAVSSLLYFYHKSGILNRFPVIGSYGNLYSASLTEDARDAINIYMTQQFGNPYDSYINSKYVSTDARQTLKELKAMFKKKEGPGSPLYFRNNNSGGGAHEVTAYKLERIGKSSSFDLKLYDSNQPGSYNQIIRIDSSANTWTDQTGLGWGSGSYGFFLGVVSKEHLNTPILSRAPNPKVPHPTVSLESPSDIELFNISKAEIEITSSSGETSGYVDSLIQNNIPDVFPIVPITGSAHPPIGYMLPADDYSIKLSNFEETKSYLFFIADSSIYNYVRNDANENQTDILKFSEGITVVNPDQETKSMDLETVITGEDNERIFITNNIEVAQNDSINIKEKNGKDLVIENYGSSKEYDLKVIDANPEEEVTFNHSGISLSPNTGYQVVPSDNLESDPVKILIDNGNDGTFDDTISVSNQVTGIKDGFGLSVPKEFRLEQNYPNPFNPTTTIKVAIPESGNYTLSVYNILGQEVANLFSGQLKAGYHRFNFDGSNFSTGVYIYTLRGNNVNISKKMMLMK